MEDCPLCEARAAVERLAHGWKFCCCCAQTFLVDAGLVIRIAGRS